MSGYRTFKLPGDGESLWESQIDFLNQEGLLEEETPEDSAHGGMMMKSPKTDPSMMKSAPAKKGKKKTKKGKRPKK